MPLAYGENKGAPYDIARKTLQLFRRNPILSYSLLIFKNSEFLA